MIGRGQGCSLRAVLLRLLVFFKLHTRLKSLLAARALGLGLLAGHDLLGLEDTGVESSFQRSSVTATRQRKRHAAGSCRKEPFSQASSSLSYRTRRRLRWTHRTRPMTAPGRRRRRTIWERVPKVNATPRRRSTAARCGGGRQSAHEPRRRSDRQTELAT
jgi:hypothetical protein